MARDPQPRAPLDLLGRLPLARVPVGLETSTVQPGGLAAPHVMATSTGGALQCCPRRGRGAGPAHRHLPASETETSRLGLLSRDAPRRSSFTGRRHVLLPALEAGRRRSRWDRFGSRDPFLPGLWSCLLLVSSYGQQSCRMRTPPLGPYLTLCLPPSPVSKGTHSPSCSPVELGWTPNPGLSLQAPGSRLARVCVRCPSCSVDHRAPRTCAPLLLLGCRLTGQQLPGEGSSHGDAEIHRGEPNHTNIPRLLLALHPPMSIGLQQIPSPRAHAYHDNGLLGDPLKKICPYLSL